MKCPKCKGEGTFPAVRRFLVRAANQMVEDFEHDDEPCEKCYGKGYLTPEEAGLGKF